MTGKTDKKSLYDPRLRIFGELLRDIRLRSGLTQVQLVEALGMAQTYASEAERAIRRLDVVQMEEWALACGTTLLKMLAEYARRQKNPAYAKPREADGRKRENRTR